LFFFQSEADAGVAGFVRGIVTAEGLPQRAAAVTLRGEGTVQSTTTDAGGHFSFLRVSFGHYTIEASSPKGTAATQISLQSTSVVDVQLVIGKLKEIGSVQTTSGRSPGNTPVSVNTLDRTLIAALPQNQSLNRMIETVPGITRFSYNEPVAHGFHGLTYEIDGVPLPVGTASNFSELIDPRSIDSLEIFTGAFPAEFGGTRQGAVVNILSHRATDLATPEVGAFTTGVGNYGSAEAALSQALRAGNTEIFVNANTERTNRGLDSPTFDPVHDSASQSNQFIRTISHLNTHDTLAFDGSNNLALFQIPINPTANPNDPIVNPPGTNDVQREYDRFVNLAYTHTSKDDSSYTQIVPWYRYDRIAYAGDAANDLATTNGGIPAGSSSLNQDRSSEFVGLRLVHALDCGSHALKAGVDETIENFHGNETIRYFNADGTTAPPFFDNQMQRGSYFGTYIQDKYTPNNELSIFGGLRYDHSTGYVSGGQLSPRLEVNVRVSPSDVVHGYYGSLYSAPFLEDTRRAAFVLNGLGTTPSRLPVYDLAPERDQYYEFGLAHGFGASTRGYLNFWKRDVRNVLDTTQLANTPVFAVFNNTVGIAKGIEGRLEGRTSTGDSYFLSATLSQSLAGGISGGTFLFLNGPPSQQAAQLAALSSLTLQPEDHDQTFTLSASYTKRFGGAHDFFATLAPQYGTGYPVHFQNGSSHLPDHFTLDAALGRDARRSGHPGFGYTLSLQNLTNTAYLLKVNNGFNTTQWNTGFQASLRLTAAY
jgi:outer membrane receptor protein involved in Fe transport